MATIPMRRWWHGALLAPAVVAWLIAPLAAAQKLEGEELVSALQQGEHVIVIRNARSASEPPASEREAAPANIKLEREIDAYGMGEMSALTYSFRALRIPVGQTLTGPAYRSRQSAQYFGFGDIKVVDALAEPGAGGDSNWLKERVREVPPGGKNLVIITHGALIADAFGADARDFRTAETLIYRPHGDRAELVARLTIEDWAKLAVK